MVIPIQDADDPRLDPFRNVRDRHWAEEGRFLAEGRWLVERLLDSRFEVEAVFVAPRFAEEIAARAGQTPVYVDRSGLLATLPGFEFHRGVMACGRRPELPSAAEGVWTRPPRKLTVVACPDIRIAENLGAICRAAGGFGADAVLLGRRCCDVFSRRCLRVSAGTVFQLPLAICDDLPGELESMHERWGLERIAAVVDADAEPLGDYRRGDRVALLFGAEDEGLDADIATVADRRLTIPMSGRTDSLNVAMAAGIFLYELTRPGREATSGRWPRGSCGG